MKSRFFTVLPGMGFIIREGITSKKEVQPERRPEAECGYDPDENRKKIS
jgi:hypothetical protein